MLTRTRSLLLSPRTLIRLIGAALLFLVNLQLLDVLSTIRFVRIYGIGREGNPLAQMFFLHYNIAGLWLHKLLFLPFAIAPAIILLQLSRKYAEDKKHFTLISSFLTFSLAIYIYLDIQFLVIVISNFLGI